MTIGDRIRIKREELMMSQEELAIALGYKSRSSINKIEKDGRDLPQTKIMAIAKALHTTPSYIMGWDDPASEADKKKAEIMSLLSSASPNEINQVKQYIQFVLSQRESQE